MSTVHLPHCADVHWMVVGPIAPHADAVKQHFADGRYALSTVASYLSNIAHFARWARSKRLRLCRIDEVSVTEFLDQHLPHCRCEGPVRHDRCDHRAALGHLLFVLRDRDVVTFPAKITTPVDEELRLFDAYHPIPRWGNSEPPTRSCGSCSRCNYAQEVPASMGRHPRCRCRRPPESAHSCELRIGSAMESFA